MTRPRQTPPAASILLVPPVAAVCALLVLATPRDAHADAPDANATCDPNATLTWLRLAEQAARSTPRGDGPFDTPEFQLSLVAISYAQYGYVDEGIRLARNRPTQSRRDFVTVSALNAALRAGLDANRVFRLAQRHVPQSVWVLLPALAERDPNQALERLSQVDAPDAQDAARCRIMAPLVRQRRYADAQRVFSQISDPNRPSKSTVAWVRTASLLAEPGDLRQAARRVGLDANDLQGPLTQAYETFLQQGHDADARRIRPLLVTPDARYFAHLARARRALERGEMTATVQAVEAALQAARQRQHDDDDLRLFDLRAAYIEAAQLLAQAGAFGRVMSLLDKLETLPVDTLGLCKVFAEPGVAVSICALAGRLDEARRRADDGQGGVRPDCLPALAEAYCVAGRREEARALALSIQDPSARAKLYANLARIAHQASRRPRQPTPQQPAPSQP
jgi:hypothetical protein